MFQNTGTVSSINGKNLTTFITYKGTILQSLDTINVTAKNWIFYLLFEFLPELDWKQIIPDPGKSSGSKRIQIHNTEIMYLPDGKLQGLQPEQGTVLSNELQPEQLGQPTVLARIGL